VSSETDAFSRAELKEATLTGLRWMTMAKVAVEAIAFVTSIVLAHLISPAEFGRASIGLIVATVAMLLTWDGFGAPLVQRKAIERAHMEATALMSLAFGVTLSAATFLLAPLVEPIFGERVVSLIQLASPAFLIAVLGIVPQSILQRRLDFRRLSAVDVIALASGSLASLGLATLAGLNAEAVVLGSLVMNATRSALLLASVPPVAPRWRRAAMAEMARFGFPAAMSSLAFSGIRNVDYAIVGARLGAAQVGFYWRAFQFGVDYQGKISGVMVKMALPVYSRTRDLDHMRAVRGRILRVNTAVLFPFLIMLLATAPVALPFLLGSNWEPAVVPTQILVALGLAAAVNVGTGPLIMAAGHPRALMTMNVIYLVIYATVVYVTSGIGLIAVCIGVACTGLLRMVAVYHFLLDRLMGIPLRTLATDVGPALLSCAALFAVAAPLTALGEHIAAPAVITLAAACLGGGAAYALALRRAAPDVWSDFALLARRIAGRGPRRAGSGGGLRESPAHGH
jgi:lipopolysaccharide exporter